MSTAEPASSGMPAVALALFAASMLVEGRGAFVQATRTQRRGAPLRWRILGVFLSSIGGTTFVATVANSLGGSPAWGWVGALLGPAAAWYLSGMARRAQERAMPIDAEARSRDPGWPVWMGPMMLFEVAGRRRTRDALAPRGPLITVRYLYIAFVSSLLLFWFVLSFVTQPAPGTRAPDPASAAPVVAAFVLMLGAASLAIGERLGRRVVEADRSSLLAVCRETLFARIALAEAPALIAFVGTFLTVAPWLYPVALVAVLPAFVRLAPSTSNILRIDEARRQQGQPGSLFELLTEPPSQPPSTVS